VLFVDVRADEQIPKSETCEETVTGRENGNARETKRGRGRGTSIDVGVGVVLRMTEIDVRNRHSTQQHPLCGHCMVNLCWPAPPVTNRKILSDVILAVHMPLCIWIIRVSSLMWPSLFPYSGTVVTAKFADKPSCRC